MEGYSSLLHTCTHSSTVVIFFPRWSITYDTYVAQLLSSVSITSNILSTNLGGGCGLLWLRVEEGKVFTCFNDSLPPFLALGLHRYASCFWANDRISVFFSPFFVETLHKSRMYNMSSCGKCLRFHRKQD